MRKMLIAVLLATGAMMVPATSAVASGPTGEYTEFAQCPYKTSGVVTCIFAKTESGEVVLGKRTVPISKTITLQGGARKPSEGVSEFVGAANGETLSPTPQNVPAGLAGFINCQEIKGSGFWEGVLRSACEAAFEKGLTGVAATTEIANSASSIRLSTRNLLAEKEVALKLPVKVHLENALLGSECYIGSSTTPITLELTTGTTSPPAPNKPIKGKTGEVKINPAGTIVTVKENSLVDNAFSAPEATGCGGVLSFLIDPIIDAQLGLPSASGSNTGILDGTLKSGEAEAVEESVK